MVHEVCVYCILKISAAVVRKENVDRFAPGPRIDADARYFTARVTLDGIVDGGDDVRVRCEESIRFDFLQGLRDGFLAKRTADFFQRVELRGGFVGDEIDVGEAALWTRASAPYPEVIAGLAERLHRSNRSSKISYLAEKPEHAKAAAVDAELWRRREAEETVG